MDTAEKTKPALPPLGYSPSDFPKLTGGAISRTRVYEALRSGRLKAKKAGQRTLITPEEARRFIESLSDWQPNAAEADAHDAKRPA